jgi:hypothetical protein
MGKQRGIIFHGRVYCLSLLSCMVILDVQRWFYHSHRAGVSCRPTRRFAVTICFGGFETLICYTHH